MLAVADVGEQAQDDNSGPNVENRGENNEVVGWVARCAKVVAGGQVKVVGRTKVVECRNDEEAAGELGGISALTVSSEALRRLRGMSVGEGGEKVTFKYCLSL